MILIDKKLSEIKPYENNPRDNKKAIPLVKKSIEEFGFLVPIVIDAGGVIVAGHTRYAAAQEIGLETVPCVMADTLNEKQIRAFRIADNKCSDYSIWDNKKLLEELEDLEDEFTGFETSDVFDDTLDESDNAVLQEDREGVTYSVKFESQDREQIEKIIEKWNEIV